MKINTKNRDSAMISVITPTYNRAHLLEETIASILNQTYTNFEYFIMDDGSIDNTADIVKPFLHDKRVSYYRHENMGESKTTNRGYSLANGELSIVINSDDPLYRNDYFALAVDEFSKEPDILAVYPDYLSIDIHSRILRKIVCPDFDFVTMLLSNKLVLGPGMMIKTSILKKIGFRNESLQYTGDLDISLKLARLGKIKHLNICAATHRDHEGNAAKDPCSEKIAKELLHLYLKVFRGDKSLMPEIISKKKYAILKNAILVCKKTNKGIPLSFNYLLLEYNDLFANRLILILFFCYMQICYLLTNFKSALGVCYRYIWKTHIKSVKT